MQKIKIKPEATDTPIPPADSTIKKGEKKTKTSPEPVTMEELLSQTGYLIKGHKRRDMVEGTITTVTPRSLLLDIGGKSEAVVHEKEIPFITDLLKELHVGERITVQVVNPENDRGQTVVSLRKTALNKRWELLGEKMKQNETVEVVIREMSRGGFLVDYAGLRGFIPLSQIDSEFTRLGDRASGRRLTVKIIELDRGANRLVLSQSGHTTQSEKQKEALKLVEIGKTYKAEVTGIAPFGAFVSVAITPEVNLSGLIHISEIAWEKVESTASYIKTGQRLDVKAIGADQTNGKLTLSLKQLTPDPWLDVVKMFSIDQTIKGKVARVSDYGIFVTLLPGIEGLIHISKLAPGEEPKLGEDIECTVEEVIPEKRKISLSLVTHAKPIGYR